jgi:hypothetical protein
MLLKLQNWSVKMAEINRTPRDLTSRDKTARAVYVPPSNLPDPTPDAGSVYRWIATHILGQANPTNVSQKMREGWEPVKAVDHPELMLTGSAGTGNVEIGGLMLCKMPRELAQARDEYYNKQSQNQMDSVDNSFMRNSDPRMPLFAERKSTTSRGSGFGSGSK